jgi:hypothetical protein
VDFPFSYKGQIALPSSPFPALISVLSHKD